MTKKNEDRKVPPCFGGYIIGEKATVRNCYACIYEDTCIGVELSRGESSMATATKLDGGKPKLSLLHPAMVMELLPVSKDETGSIVKAMYSLSVAAHAKTSVDFTTNIGCAIQEIVKFLGSTEKAMIAATTAMEYGANKPEYGRNNWKKGFEWSRLLDAAMRHGLAIISGEAIDRDSGNRHVAHMLGAINMLLGNHDMKIGVNDIY